jgi:hypothetical protein
MESRPASRESQVINNFEVISFSRESEYDRKHDGSQRHVTGEADTRDGRHDNQDNTRRFCRQLLSIAQSLRHAGVKQRRST